VIKLYTKVLLYTSGIIQNRTKKAYPEVKTWGKPFYLFLSLG